MLADARLRVLASYVEGDDPNRVVADGRVSRGDAARHAPWELGR